jgi:phosphatidylserine decarboxylase
MGRLSFSDRAARSVWRIVPKRALSGAIGWGASRGLPASLRVAVLSRFAKSYGIDVSEAEKPLGEYSGVDDFFTRKLRPDARPIDPSPGRVVSPADGTIVASGTVSKGQLLQAKGMLFSLSELLADEDAARQLEGGSYLITYLSPKDYHRVHTPIGGRVIGWHHIPGSLLTVNARSVLREPGLFTRNERFVTLIQGEAGLAAVVMVAAVGVGHITAAYDPEVATHHAEFARAAARHRRYDTPKAIGRGDEVGTFHLGSTSIVIFEPGRVVLDPLSAGGSTKMGAAIGRIASPSGAARGVSSRATSGEG